MNVRNVFCVVGLLLRPFALLLLLPALVDFFDGAMASALTFATTSAVVFVGGISCSDASDSRVMLQGDGRPVPVTVEFALTPASQARGLMWRDELPADHGMLFVFSDSRPRSFWMKNTPLPLDIIYIGEDARIVSIAARTTPYSTRSIPDRRGRGCRPTPRGAGR